MTGFTGPLPPATFNMARYCLATNAEQSADKVSLIVLAGSGASDLAEQWTYTELDTAVRRIAGALRAEGIASGDRLLIRLDNTSDYALLFFGALAAGIVPIPASSQLTAREAQHMATDADVTAIACTETAHADHASGKHRLFSPSDIAAMRKTGTAVPYADTGADDPAFLVYTSGTTGRPKGVLHAHRSAWGRRPMYRGWYDITAQDRVLHAGAFNWTYTLGTGLTDPWANGATSIVYTGQRDPKIWPELIRQTHATIFAAVPSLYRQIMKYTPDGLIDTGTLRHGLTAGETLPSSVADEWMERTNTPLCEALGMSELSTYISASPTQPARPGTIGQPQDGRCIAILPIDAGTTPVPANQTGLLAVHRSDPALMLDYWNRPDETAQVFRGDWFLGGDLASMDDDGYLTHHGRADDVMNAFGYRVSPMEVEAVVATAPGVAEVAVTEIRVQDGISIIAAFIVRTTQTASAEIITAHASARLADYKCPKQIVFIDTLPRTTNGKIRRPALQSLYDVQKVAP